LEQATQLTDNSVNWKRIGMPIILMVLVLVADQFFKYWVKMNMTTNPVIPVFGDWFELNFTENNGMAFGLEIPGAFGKISLTTFRIVFVIVGFLYLIRKVKQNARKGFLICISLIIAGALGNIIDSVFYGVWFADINHYDGGYFYGRVVDMLHFPIIHGHYPSWFPFWSGESFVFFSPVFNIADTAISTGVISIFVFQKRYFPVAQFNQKEPVKQENEEEVIVDNTANESH
jgi:signal peptidase II